MNLFDIFKKNNHDVNEGKSEEAAKTTGVNNSETEFYAQLSAEEKYGEHHHSPLNFSASKQQEKSQQEPQQNPEEQAQTKKLKCPYCQGNNIYELPPHLRLSPFNFRYQCLDCNSRFNDDTHTQFEMGIPSIETWLHCWYLIGCTNSINYIANQLHLDTATITEMLKTLREIFKVEQPLTQMQNFKDWSQNYGNKYSLKIKEYLSKNNELIQADKPHAPIDTAEYRRQKERKTPKNTL